MAKTLSCFEKFSIASVSSGPGYDMRCVSMQPQQTTDTYPNSEHSLHPNHEVFGLFVSYGSEDVGHSSVGGVSAVVSGRANGHTSAAAFWRLQEVSRGGDGLEEEASEAVSPGKRGPNPPTEEVSPDGVSRFLFPELLVVIPTLDGCVG